eukprot:TRINITY_DN11054_c0_g1_i8.p4 TRINITY_DN11054_c0_g1~~TRINITY_DN11054_c0_g1_i8.p4  ORF type:complete len:100 (+),score=10.30 TRINITY_DN11054_c0_g1_i8:417-716(+)
MRVAWKHAWSNRTNADKWCDVAYTFLVDLKRGLEQQLHTTTSKLLEIDLERASVAAKLSAANARLAQADADKVRSLANLESKRLSAVVKASGLIATAVV